MRRVACAAIALLSLTWADAVMARPLDCPLRDKPFSLNTPLIDVLLAPAATQAVDAAALKFLKRLPIFFKSTQAPTFAAIISLEEAGFFARASADELSAIGLALRQVAVTPEIKAARCARYDDERPVFAKGKGLPRLLLFEKITGFKDTPSVDAAHMAFLSMAQRRGWEIATRRGWEIATTDKGGAINSATLKQFDAIIWNNVSGDVLTLKQRRALQHYIKNGGGFVAVHGSAGDPHYFWDWYADELIGARFTGHPAAPQFQEGRLKVDDGQSAIVRGLPPEFVLRDEWYSFAKSPRQSGAHVLLTLDETSYKPIGMGRDIRMGADHPIAWTRCVGDGRSFYAAPGHLPEIYAEPHYVLLLEQAVLWAIGQGETSCKNGAEAKLKR